MKKIYFGLVLAIGLVFMLSGWAGAKPLPKQAAKKEQKTVETKKSPLKEKARVKEEEGSAVKAEVKLSKEFSKLSSAEHLMEGDIYVNGEIGNDDNDGFSWGTAKKTIQAGIDDTSPGRTCYVAGEWQGHYLIYSEDTNGEEFPIEMKSDIVLKGEASGVIKPEIQYFTSMSGMGPPNIVFDLKGVSYSSVEGFKIECTGCFVFFLGEDLSGIPCFKNKISDNDIMKSPDYGGASTFNVYGVFSFTGSYDNNIEKNTFKDCVVAILQEAVYSDLENGTISENLIMDCQRGICIWDKNNNIKRNIIRGCGYGIGIYGIICGNLVTNNTLVSNQVGIEVEPAPGLLWDPDCLQVVNNIITGGSSFGMWGSTWVPGYGAWERIIRYNDVWDNTPNYGGTIPDMSGLVGNISDDPRFVDPVHYDYHLPVFFASPACYPHEIDYTRTSPCMEAGSVYIDWDYISDITDYYGEAPDIGAYEAEITLWPVFIDHSESSLY